MIPQCLIGDTGFLLLMALWLSFVSLLGVILGAWIGKRGR